MFISTRAQKWILLAALLTWPALVRANIGDTLSDLRGRYGSAKDMGNQMLFTIRIVNDQIVRLTPSDDPHDGFSVTIYFDGSHSAMEVFTRNTSDPAKSDLTQKDIDDILAAESDGLAWGKVQHGTEPTWLRADHKLVARFSPNASGKSDDASVLVIMVNSK